MESETRNPRADHARESSPASEGPRAIVWTPPGVEPPGELLAALTKGNLGVERVTSPYLALAHLCRLSRIRPGDSKVASAALVLVNPGQLANPGQVCDAASRYAAQTRCWMYEPGKNQRLRAVVQQDVDNWLKSPGSIEARAVIPSRPAATPAADPDAAPRPLPLRSENSRTAPKTASAGPKLRLAGDSGVQDSAETADQTGTGEGAPRPREVLSSEELEMLLDDAEPRNP